LKPKDNEVLLRTLQSWLMWTMFKTYGTNGGGMDLFAVLAEVEGTGVPLAYCLVDPPRVEKKARSDPGQ
jgi:hypothetical protein